MKSAALLLVMMCSTLAAAADVATCKKACVDVDKQIKQTCKDQKDKKVQRQCLLQIPKVEKMCANECDKKKK